MRNADLGVIVPACRLSMSVSLSHSPPTASVKHLIRHFEPGCPSHPQKGLSPGKVDGCTI